MRVYEPITSVGYQFFNTNGDLKNSEKIDSRDFFEEEKIFFTRGTKPNRTKIGDIVELNGNISLVFSEKAKSIFANSGQFFKFTNLEDFELFIPQIIDALDYEKSEIDYFDDEKLEIMSIDKYSFKGECISDLDAFSLPLPAEATFLTEKFVEKYKANNLTGIEFYCVYDSEKPENVGKFIQEM